MKKYFFVVVALQFFLTPVVIAQVNHTPETPRNYKPKPKELLPMPDSLTDSAIFPVLGNYTLTDKKNTEYAIAISRDDYSKGTIWISGLPQGKIKAELRGAPATYKIPVQLPLQNDEMIMNDNEANSKVNKKSGKSVAEGTLIFNESDSTLYINIGDKFKEDNPASIFPQINAENNIDANETSADANVNTKKKKAVKRPAGAFYTGKKIIDISSAQ